MKVSSTPFFTGWLLSGKHEEAPISRLTLLAEEKSGERGGICRDTVVHDNRKYLICEQAKAAGTLYLSFGNQTVQEAVSIEMIPKTFKWTCRKT
jgi:hypothetical protein